MNKKFPSSPEQTNRQELEAVAVADLCQAVDTAWLRHSDAVKISDEGLQGLILFTGSSAKKRLEVLQQPTSGEQGCLTYFFEYSRFGKQKSFLLSRGERNDDVMFMRLETAEPPLLDILEGSTWCSMRGLRRRLEEGSATPQSSRLRQVLGRWAANSST